MARITEMFPYSLGYLIHSHGLKCDQMTLKCTCPFLACPLNSSNISTWLFDISTWTFNKHLKFNRPKTKP